MLQQMMGAEMPPKERVQLLNDNCDKVEEVSYNKPFSSDELTQKRVELENVSIHIADLEKEKKDFNDALKTEMDPLKVIHKDVIKNLKEKTIQVTESCYAFIDEESRMVGYYNREGMLIYSRPANTSEMQRTIHMDMRRTGTDD